MINFQGYEFSVLRYVHDTLTGEFVNVGVVIYCEKEKWISAQCRNTYARVSAVFPNLNSTHFRKMMKFVQTEFGRANQSLSTEFQFSDINSMQTLLHRILPKDDSSLQWSPVSAGLTVNLEKELSTLFQRYVSHYDVAVARDRRTEQDIWKDFKKTLESFSLAEAFQPKRIAVKDDEIEFQHSWKNGIWHCIEPISFDLSDGDYCKDKAHRWLGQLSSIQNSADKFKVYLLVSPPTDQDLQPAFNKALSILRKIPVDSEIFLEGEAPRLAEEIQKKMEDHSQSLH
ncbi:DUF3037 domain-containing protein [Pseudomonas syringae]|uniref:DUF3037 domain-containing protein n=1 Tax=Pseudomonas syringae TaxID=317 RepID=UPI0034D3E9F0